MNTPAAPSGSGHPEPVSRLLLICYEYPPLGGGLGKAVRYTALELARRGFEVAILTSKFGDQPSRDSDGPLEILRIPVRRRHLKHATVTDVLSFGPSGVLLARRRLGAFRPQRILSFLTVPSGVVGAWLAWRLNVPHLTLLRGTDVPGYRELKPWMHTLAAPLTRLIWRRSFRVISNSEAKAREAERALPGISIPTVHNGVDLDRFRPPEPGLRQSRPLKVLYSGRLVHVKRLELLLKIWADVLRRLEAPAVLELAGYGPDRQKLERLALNLGIADRVTFLGFLDEDRLIRAYQEASIYVSLSADEGLPNSVLEALACGLPAVLSDIGPHREILAQRPAGRLCSTDEPDSIRDALLELLQDADKRELASHEARAAVEGRFSWEQSAEGLIRLFHPED